MRRSASRAIQVAGILATLGIFIVITALESHWIGQASEAELERQRIRLGVAIEAIKKDLDRELSRAYFIFQFAPGAGPESWGEMTSQGYEVWKKSARFPGLVERLLLVQPEGAGGGLEMAAYHPETSHYDPSHGLPSSTHCARNWHCHLPVSAPSECEPSVVLCWGTRPYRSFRYFPRTPAVLWRVRLFCI